MSINKVFWFPVATIICFPITFIVSYILSVKFGHVTPVFPYISDTGTTAPESCVFGQLMNIGAVLVGVDVYIRYKQIKDLGNVFTLRLVVKKINIVSIWVGVAMAFGISLVGNFQETNFLSVHLVGALMAFGMGVVYFFLQTIISYKTTPLTCTKFVCHLRLFCSVFCFLSFISTFIFAMISLKKFEGDNPRKWTKDNAGYSFHIVSTLSEWITALFFVLFLATFMNEFRIVDCSSPKITVNIIEDMVPPRFKNFAVIPNENRT